MEVDKENAGPGPGPGPASFSKGQLDQMLGQCLKLASENKITVHNTWSLPLIENLPDLIREEGAEQTNFQRASVTLDAGVKIYSYRVDSVHTETFKILGSMGRASGPQDEGAGGEEGGDGGGGEAGAPKRRRRAADLNPEATLENIEALTLKKFDLAFAVDPLFKKTSAQFDEGGAKGLLLNNLSVYRGCDIVFDSMDVPERAVDSAAFQPSAAEVDLASLQPQLAAAAQLTGQERISPTLDEILRLLGEAPGPGAAAEAEDFVRRVAAAAGDVQPAPSGSLMQTSTFSGQQAAREGEDGAQSGRAGGAGKEEGGYTAQSYDGAGPGPQPADLGADYEGYGGYDGQEDDSGGFGGAGPGFEDDYSDGEEGQQSVMQQPLSAVPLSAAKGGCKSLGGDAIEWLISGGAHLGGKGWAGGSHWRYRAQPQQAGGGEGEEGEGAGGRKKRATRRKNDPLDFVALLAEAEQPVFEKLPARKTARKAAPAKTLLPEDLHYKAETLNRYALRPRTAIRGRSGRGDAAAGQGGSSEEEAADLGDDFGGGFGGGFDSDDDGAGAAGDSGWADMDFGGGGGGGDSMDSTLLGGGGETLAAPRRVERVEVNYSRAAKQVDVRALKETLWAGIHRVLLPGQPPEGATLSFQDVLATVREHNLAGRLEDLSVHLCFICLLHLANEHGLVVRDAPQLDQLVISNVPAA